MTGVFRWESWLSASVKPERARVSARVRSAAVLRQIGGRGKLKVRVSDLADVVARRVADGGDAYTAADVLRG